jgi:hypothetical protein
LVVAKLRYESVVLSVQAAVATDEDDDETEPGIELLLGAMELGLLERDELLTEVLVELVDELLVVPHRLPVRTGTSAAAAPLVPWKPKVTLWLGWMVPFQPAFLTV